MLLGSDLRTVPDIISVKNIKILCTKSIQTRNSFTFDFIYQSQKIRLLNTCEFLFSNQTCKDKMTIVVTKKSRNLETFTENFSVSTRSTFCCNCYKVTYLTSHVHWWASCYIPVVFMIWPVISYLNTLFYAFREWKKEDVKGEWNVSRLYHDFFFFSDGQIDKCIFPPEACLIMEDSEYIFCFSKVS